VKLQPGKKGNKITGSLSFSDPASGISFTAATFTSLTFNGNQAHITGTGKGGKKTISFTVDVIDNGFPGTSDSYSIHLSNGYSASGTLLSGDIFIN
jgi:hypothetical protein